MEQFVYPAVFYYDKEYNNYAVAFHDVNIYTEGDSIEDAYKNAQKFLLAYIECCKELGEAPEEASRYQDVIEQHKNETVMIISVEYNDKSKNSNDQNCGILEDIDSFETIKNDLDDDDFSLPPIE